MATRRVFDLTTNLPKLTAAMQRAPQRMLTNVDNALGRGAIELSRAEREAAPKFRSELANSILYQRVGLLEHLVAARGKSYGPYVEDGTGPGGRPPLAEMEAWIRLKGIQPRTPGMSQRSLAALMRRSIARRGIKSNPFFSRTLEAMLPRFDELLQKAADDGLQAIAKDAGA